MQSHVKRGLAAMASATVIGTSAQAQTLVVLNKSEANVSMIDATSGDVYATIGVGIGPHEAATSPDGKTVIVCNYGQREPGHTLTVIEVEKQRAARTIDLVDYHRPHGIVYLDERTIVVTAEVEKKLLVVDVEDGRVVSAIDTDQDISHMVAVTPDERYAFVANIGSGSASVIDLKGRQLVKVVETAPQAEGVAAHRSRPEVWVSNRRANTISVISTESLEVLSEFDCGEVPIRVTFTPDGRKALVSCARSGEVAIFDVATRSEIARVPMDIDESEVTTEGRLFGKQFGQSPVPVGILVEPRGTLAYVANTNADVITVIDIERAKIVDRLIAGKEPDGLAWTHIGGPK